MPEPAADEMTLLETTPELRGVLSLRTTPPKPPLSFLVRPHLSLDRYRQAGVQVIEIAAPHGFGRTSQLAQWHSEALLSGLTPLWINVDQRDDMARFIQGLTYSLGQHNALPPGFAEWIGSCPDPHQALTAWLAEIARSPQDVLLLIDDADRLPAASETGALAYIIANAPHNLMVAYSTLANSPQTDATLWSGAAIARITEKELRLREEETARLVARAMGDSASPDLAARVQELTDGWPLGVRLAAAAHLRNPNPGDFALAATADLTRYFLNSVIAQLQSGMVDLLVDAAHFDPICAELCITALGPGSPVADLNRLADESPILTRNSGEGWLRLHPAAREVLIQMHSERPLAERRCIAAAASQWYAGRGLYEEAAQQARLAGDFGEATKFAEMGLRQMTFEGRSSEVLQWFDQVSPEEVRQRPGFWAPTAWALAISDRYDEARRLTERILARRDTSEAEQFEAELIRASIAGYRDDLKALEQFAARWPEPPAAANPGEVVICTILQGHVALFNGRTEEARLRWNVTEGDRAIFKPVSRAFTDLTVGLSYLWEGKPQIAYEHLGVALLTAEAQMDRRNRVISMLAAALARACFELGRAEEARVHLALRMPIIERQGLPDTVIAAYVTLAELADQQGRQDQALVHLGALEEIGRSRDAVRIVVTALAEQARMHALHGRMHLAAEAAKRLDRTVASRPDQLATATRLWIDLHARLARATVLLGSDSKKDWLAGEAAAGEAEKLAVRLNRGGDLIRAKFLRSRALALLNDKRAARQHAEAVNMCEAAGLTALLLSSSGATGTETNRNEMPSPTETPGASVQDNNILTPREQDVLLRLVNHMSNKEIALSIGLSEETVKWHLKNLFTKLGAGDRKSAVARAGALGFI